MCTPPGSRTPRTRPKRAAPQAATDECAVAVVKRNCFALFWEGFGEVSPNAEAR